MTILNASPDSTLVMLVPEESLNLTVALVRTFGAPQPKPGIPKPGIPKPKNGVSALAGSEKRSDGTLMMTIAKASRMLSALLRTAAALLFCIAFPPFYKFNSWPKMIVNIF